MENQVREKAKEEVKVEVKAEVKVRADINDMVKSIGFVHEKTRYGEIVYCAVKLFNGEVIKFKDSEGLYDLFRSFKGLDVKDFIKSKRLVEEVKTSKVDLIDGEEDDGFYTYLCVIYDLADGSSYRLFPMRMYVDRKILDNYYQSWKKQQKQGK